MWPKDWRATTWTRLAQPWDIVIVGGGIVGDGGLRAAAQRSWRALLVEQRDFAWGTSSRSSKFVHGGLRYLKDLDFSMAWQSIRGRQALLQAGPGLVTPLDFLLTRHAGGRPGRLGYELALTLYDLFAGRRDYRRFTRAQLRRRIPDLADADLLDSFACTEAQTDDARLTLRVLSEGLAAGGLALNYVRAEAVVREAGRVVGVQLRDQIEGRTARVSAPLVVNATGAWADQLRGQRAEGRLIRPLRGSHLVFPARRLPVADVVSLAHPWDQRPVTIAPWQGVTLVGSTDVDHAGALDDEPRITPAEAAYLMAAVDRAFPALGLTPAEAQASYAGIRPVINTGKRDPSKESRDHVILYDQGLVTVTGGKLTTFQAVAEDVLRSGPGRTAPAARRSAAPALEPLRVEVDLPEPARSRLLGRYGNRAGQVVASARPGDLEFIPGTSALWVELRWAARHEAVMHLEDLCLRRVGLGLLLPEGGKQLLPQVRAICQPELGWDEARWEAEEAAYTTLWNGHYRPPDPALIPEWRAGRPAALAPIEPA